MLVKMKRMTFFSRLLITSALMIFLTGCRRKPVLNSIQVVFRFSVNYNRYDYTYLRTLEDTSTTFDGMVIYMLTGKVITCVT